MSSSKELSTKERGLRSRLGELNPAFAAAHGISPQKKNSILNKEGMGTVPFEGLQEDEPFVLPISPCPVSDFKPKGQKASGLAQVKKIITKARSNGKLQASDASLETPLPKILFEFPILADTVDMSMDANPDTLKPWESHVAETLVMVDFSDNEGITEFPSLDNKDNLHTNCNGVERYRSVQVFRARRCSLKSFPVTKALEHSWERLITLDLSGNRLSGEFPLLFLPKSIRELDLSCNKLTSLKSTDEPSTSIDLPQLTSLDISSNEITSTGISPVMHVPLLQRLNCGHNKIYNLSYMLKSISSCEKSLTTLQAPKSMLSDLDGEQPINLTSFVTLLSVDLSGNCLCQIPKVPSTLQRLNVNYNLIKGIRGLLEDDCSGELYPSELVVLQLQRNKISTLDPETVSKLTKLYRLDLQYNFLQNLPTELGYLTNLSHLVLEGNHVLALRSSGVRGDCSDTKAILARLRNLASEKNESEGSTVTKDNRSSDGCEIKEPKEKTTTQAKQKTRSKTDADVGSMLSSLLVGKKILNYEGKHAHMLPFQLLEELGTNSKEMVDAIERFKIAKNQLQNIEEEWFRRLPQLTALEAQDNRLADLPTAIRELALTHIYLSRNRLDSHAVQFSILHTSTKSNLLTDSLQILDLSSNCLESVPPGLLQQFKSLRWLNLSKNKISSLKNIVDAPRPPALPALEHLDFSENRIADMGGDLFPLMLAAGCPNLQTLLLHNNELQMIPLTLGLLENLEVFDIRGNPQRMIRYEVLDKNTSNILSYLRSRMTTKAKANAADKMRQLLSTPVPDADQMEEGGYGHPYENAEDEKKDDDRCVISGPNKTPEPTSEVVSILDTNSKNAEKSPPTMKSTLPQAKAGTPQCAPPVATSSSKTYGPVKNSKKPVPPTSGRNNNQQNKKLTSPLLEELEQSIEKLAAEVDLPGLSEPKRYAMKKKLAMERSKRLREERRLKQEQIKYHDRWA